MKFKYKKDQVVMFVSFIVLITALHYAYTYVINPQNADNTVENRKELIVKNSVEKSDIINSDFI